MIYSVRSFRFHSFIKKSNELWRCFRSWKKAVWLTSRCFHLWKEAVEKSKPLAPGSGMESAWLVNPQEWLQERLNLAQAVYLSVLFQSFQNSCAFCSVIIATYWLRSRLCFEALFCVCNYLTMMASCMVCREAIQLVLFNMSPHGTIL